MAMIGKLVARDDTHKHDRGNYRNRYRSYSNDRRNQYEQNSGRPKYEQNWQEREF